MNSQKLSNEAEPPLALIYRWPGLKGKCQYGINEIVWELFREDEKYGRESTAMALNPPIHLRARWRVKIAAYLIITLFSLAILELLSYGYLRIFEGYDGKHLMNYEFDDYKNIRPTPGYMNTNGTYHNLQGFRRTTETSREKSNDIFRIFIMGGSTAYGLGSQSRYGKYKYSVIRNDETIDYYLEQYLNSRISNKQIEVINAAITSQQSHHHLIYLNQTILKYQPDMVVFIDGFNDYYPYEKGFDQFRDYAYQERAHHFMAEPTLDAWMDYTGWWLFRKSHFIYVAAKTIRPFWIYLRRASHPHEREKIDSDVAIENLHENAEKNFLRMVERNSLILMSDGILPIFTVQPEIVFNQAKKFTNLEKTILNEMNSEWQENYADYKNRARPFVIESMKRVTAKAGSIFIDLTDPFDGMEEDAYTDYCHLTPLGNKRLAQYLGVRMLPFVAENIKNS